MNHTTSIGLDVHARSIAAAALNPLTGEVVTKTFAYSPGEVASWALGFDSPKAVYESGVTGFHLCRELNALGLECAVGASSKMQRPPADVKRKNDLSDAQFLARLLATHNVTEVFVPDAETEAARDLVRAHADARADLTRARQRLNLFLMRHGHVFCEKGPTGAPVGSWTKAHWAWIRQISFPDEADEEALAFYIAQVRHMEGQKRELEKFIRAHAREPRWRGRVDALRCLKGIARFRCVRHCASFPTGLLERLHFSMSIRFTPRDGAESEGARDEVQRKRLKPGHSCPWEAKPRLRIDSVAFDFLSWGFVKSISAKRVDCP